MKLLLPLILLAVLQTNSFAQEVSKDSLVVDKTAQLMRRMDSIRFADSLRRVDLQKEIEQLRGSAKNKDREALVQKLRKAEQEDSLRNQKQVEQLQILKASAQGYPVAPFGDTLFTIYTRIGSFSAKDRAQAIKEKIKTLYKNIDFATDSRL